MWQGTMLHVSLILVKYYNYDSYPPRALYFYPRAELLPILEVLSLMRYSCILLD